VSRYSHEKMRGMGTIDGFHIIRPDKTIISDANPRTIVQELNRLNEHIKRLEEAGDEMAQEYRGKLGFDTYDELLLNRWTKAKEAKP
jgi:hypothetical protein